MSKKLFIAVFLLCFVQQSIQAFNFNQCFQGIGLFSDEITGIVEGFQNRNITVRSFLKKSYNLVQNVDPLFKLCGLNIPYLDKTQQWGPKNADNCFVDIANIYDSAFQAYQILTTGANQFAIFGLIGNVTSQINQIKNDCQVIHFDQKNQIFLDSSLHETYQMLTSDSSKCLSESNELASAALGIAFQIANKNVNGTIDATINTLKELPGVLKNCGQENLYEKIKIFEEVNFTNCGQDLKEITVHVRGLIQNIQNKAYFSLISNAQGVYNEIKDLNNHCRKQQNNFIASKLLKLSDDFYLSKDE